MKLIINFRIFFYFKWALIVGGRKYFLGVKVKQCEAGIFIHQRKYAKEILARFVMDQFAFLLF